MIPKNRYWFSALITARAAATQKEMQIEFGAVELRLLQCIWKIFTAERRRVRARWLEDCAGEERSGNIIMLVPDPGSSLFRRTGSALRVFFVSIVAALIGTIVGGVCVGAAVIALIQPNHVSRTAARTTVAAAESSKAANSATSRQAQNNPPDALKTQAPASPAQPPAPARPMPTMQAHASSPTPAHVAGPIKDPQKSQPDALPSRPIRDQRTADNRYPASNDSVALRAASPNAFSPPNPRYAKRRSTAAVRARQPVAGDNADQAYAADGRPVWNGYGYQRSRQIYAARQPMVITPAQRSAMRQPPPPDYAEQSDRGGGFFGLFNFFGNDNWHND
jgi:hypothetical protein